MPTLNELLESLWIRIGPVLSELYPDAHPRYAARHQHLNVIEALRTRDAYSLREAIRLDLFEGGQNLLRHLHEHDTREATEQRPRRA